MPRPICVKCKMEMRPIKNEFMVKDRVVDGFPATVWSGDLYECPGCEIQIVTGFGKGRVITGKDPYSTTAAKGALKIRG